MRSRTAGNRWIVAGTGIILALVLLASSGALPGEAGPRVDRVTILGGPPGGVFGIFATGIATYLSRAVPGLDVTMTATGGSVENVRRVNAGDAEMGLAFASDLHEGFYGLDAFRGSPQTNLRAIGLVFTGVVHLITHRDSGIRTVEGLAGKRVAVGTPGSGTFASAERVFRKLDLWDRITRVPLLGATAGAALSEGRVDAFFWTGPYPDRVSIEAGLIRPIHFIDAYTPLSRTDFLRVYPYFMKYTIPAGAYPGIADSVPALGIPLLWFSHRDVPADLVQKIVQAAYSRDGHGHMLRVHAASADMMSLKALLGVTVPLHRGAEAHWVSVGLEIPERIRAR